MFLLFLWKEWRRCKYISRPFYHFVLNKVIVSLPTLRAEVAAHLRNCQQRLDKLPVPLLRGDPSDEMLHRISEFQQDFSGIVLDHSRDKELAHACKEHYLEFKKQVFSTIPDFREFKLEEMRHRIEM